MWKTHHHIINEEDPVQEEETGVKTSANTWQGKLEEQCSTCEYKHGTCRCPACGNACALIKGEGYFAPKCFKKKAEVQELNVEYNAYCIIRGDRDAWIKTFKVQGSNVQFKIDTSTEISIIKVATFLNLTHRPLLSPNTVKLIFLSSNLNSLG